MPDICDHFVDDDHLHWRVLLLEWMMTIEKYQFVSKDLPYWYSERANVGILAAAAWRCGYVALEEYPDTKRSKKVDPETDEKLHSSGRVDLWIGQPENAIGELIEAKLRWPLLSTPKKIKSDLEDGLKAAYEDAKRTKTGKGPTLGLTFFVPRIQATNRDIIDQQLLDLIEQADAIDAAVKAWYFPEKFRADEFMINNMFYPGVLLMAKRVWRGA